MNPAPPVTSTFIVRFAVLGTSAREAASLPAPADGSVRRRGRSRAASRGEYRRVTMRILVLTTSYPRDADDVAGTFVRDGVEALRAAGAEVRVVSPASFRHYGIAYGDGIVNNLRAAPWKALALPLFFLSFARAARRAARGADVVHAHWLPSVVPAMATGKPVVLQLWGSDAALATRARPLARWLVRRARVVVCASTALADDARALGARDVRVIPQGVRIPDSVREPDEPPHILYVGRLSEEKGVRELAEAAEGLPLVVVGDGPLRSLLPQAAGFLPPAEVGAYYERASIVVVPSRREGYGMVAREAMAHGRPVVATASRRSARRGGGRRDRPAGASARRGRAPRRARAPPRRRGAAPLARGGCARARRQDGVAGHDRGAAPRGVSVRELSRPCSAGACVAPERPSSAVSFLPSSRDRAAYEIGTS